MCRNIIRIIKTNNVGTYIELVFLKSQYFLNPTFIKMQYMLYY